MGEEDTGEIDFGSRLAQGLSQGGFMLSGVDCMYKAITV